MQLYNMLTIGYFIVSETQIYSRYQDRGSMKVKEEDNITHEEDHIGQIIVFIKDFAPRHLQQVWTTTSYYVLQDSVMMYGEIL